MNSFARIAPVSFVCLLLAASVAGGCAEGNDGDGTGFGGTGGAPPGGDGGGTQACEPGEVMSCYSGPAGTEGVGRCIAGERTCLDSGAGFGACTGQVLPTVESCLTMEDDDCDGETDDGDAGTCACSPREITSCYTGPAETLGVGACAAGRAMCNDDGTGFLSCEGEVLPGTEVCEQIGDEDCDGIPCSDPRFNRVFGGTGSDQLVGVALDSFGAIIGVGSFEGTIDLGDGPLTSPPGGRSIFVAKWGADGLLRYAKGFGAQGNQVPTAIAVDNAGDLYVVGTFDQSFSFGDGPTLNPLGPFDGFLVKLDGVDGSHIWSQDFGAVAESTGPTDVAVDASGAPSVVGNTVTPPGCIICAFDAFARRFSPTGIPDWVVEADGSGNQTAEALAVDGTGNLWIGGSYEQTLDFGSPTVASMGSDAYVTKLDALGGHDLTLSWGDSPAETVTDIALDSTGGPVIAGTFNDTINFGALDLESAGFRDYFVARLDSGGNFIFANRYGDDTDQTVLRVALDTQDNVLIAGALRGGATFAGTLLESNGADDAFVVKISQGGFFQWGKHFGDMDGQATLSVAAGPADSVLIGGRVQGTIDFGDGPHTSTDGSRDAFIAWFWP